MRIKQIDTNLTRLSIMYEEVEVGAGRDEEFRRRACR